MTLRCNARMYSGVAAAQAAWRRLFARVAQRAGVELEWLEHPPPQPLETLWTRSDLGLAFMCGWPFARANPQPHLIAAPIPADARYGGKPVYFTELVSLKSRGYTRLEDSFGGRIGYTIDHSHSGFNALRHHLLSYRAARGAPLYAEAIGPLITPKRVVEALLAGAIDVGPLDSIHYDLLCRHEAETASALQVIGRTAAAPAPPLIATAPLGAQAQAALRGALVGLGGMPDMAAVLHDLCLQGFAAVEPDDYAVTIARQREAEAANFALSA